MVRALLCDVELSTGPDIAAQQHLALRDSLSASVLKNKARNRGALGLLRKRRLLGVDKHEPRKGKNMSAAAVHGNGGQGSVGHGGSAGSGNTGQVPANGGASNGGTANQQVTNHESASNSSTHDSHSFQTDPQLSSNLSDLFHNQSANQDGGGGQNGGGSNGGSSISDLLSSSHSAVDFSDPTSFSSSHSTQDANYSSIHDIGSGSQDSGGQQDGGGLLGGLL